MSKTVDDRGLDLLAACVQANVDSLAHTNGLIQANLEHDARRFAESLVLIGDVLDQVTVMDRVSEERLGELMYRIEHADAYLAGRKQP